MSSDHGPGGSIVVGLDNSAGARAALHFALDAGAARGIPVHVVTTFVVDMTVRDRITTDLIAEEARDVRREQDRIVAEALAGMPVQPAVSQAVLHDVGGEPLLQAAQDAVMLVVGSGRTRPLDEMPLASVSEYCVRHARVPVVVVPDPSRLVDRPATVPAR